MNILHFLQSKTWYQQLAIVSFLLLSGAALLNVLTPKPNPATPFMQNSDGTTTTYTDLTFSGTSPKLPAELTLGKVISTTDLSADIIAPLKQYFRLSESGTDFGIWVGPNYSMSSNSRTKQLTIGKNQQTSSETVISKDEAIATAEELLRGLFPNLSLYPELDSVVLFNRGPELTVNHDSSAALARIYLSPMLAGLPVVERYNYLPAFELFIGAEGIEKLTITPPIISVEKTTVAKTISADVALENLKQVGGGILSARHPDLDPVDKTLLQTGDFSSVSVEYRTGADSVVIPMYRFRGEFTTSAGEKIAGEVLTPAVELGF